MFASIVLGGNVERGSVVGSWTCYLLQEMIMRSLPAGSIGVGQICTGLSISPGR